MGVTAAFLKNLVMKAYSNLNSHLLLYNQYVGLCVCANLDVFIRVQSLDKIGETVKETICCSSLKGGRGREREKERESLAHMHI